MSADVYTVHLGFEVGTGKAVAALVASQGPDTVSAATWEQLADWCDQHQAHCKAYHVGVYRRIAAGLRELAYVPVRGAEGAWRHSPLCSGSGVAPNPGCSCGLVEWLYREAARNIERRRGAEGAPHQHKCQIQDAEHDGNCICKCGFEFMPNSHAARVPVGDAREEP